MAEQPQLPRARPATGSTRSLKPRRLRRTPSVYVLDEFASDAEMAHILALAGNERLLAERGVETRHDETGVSCELPVTGDTVLETLCRRIYDALGLTNEQGATLRFRRYGPGESHPLHQDTYRVGESHLLATAMLYLMNTAAGGETHFPQAQPGPLRLKPRRGRLAVWFNHEPDGRPDDASLHEGLPVLRGEKATLTNFIYQPLAAARNPLNQRRTKGREIMANSSRHSFYCVNDGVPNETTELLRAACKQRGVEYVEIDAPLFDYDPARRLPAGALLYCPAISQAAQQVEQYLYAEGVATFYTDPAGPFQVRLNHTLLYERAGLSIPRTFYCATANRKLLRSFVAQLDGFPLVLKVPGGSRGIGVMRVDSFPALFSLVDYARSLGHAPLLTAYIADAVHWRVVVIGNRAVAAYRNCAERDDFRTYARDEASDYTAQPDPALADLAVRAVQTSGYEFGGVDILEQSDGRIFLLEANFPCYYPQAQMVAGVDIAGMMVDYLRQKTKRRESAI